MPSATDSGDPINDDVPSGLTGPIAEAEAAAADLRTTDHPMGGLGKPFNRRSPFLIGMAAAAGVAVTYGLVQLVVSVRGILILIGLALFLAIGMEPAVVWLVRRRSPRWLAVTGVFLVAFAAVGGFLAATIPIVVEQTSQLAQQVPGYLEQARDHNSLLGQLNDRFQLQQRLEQTLDGTESGLVTGLLGAGQAVFSALTSFLLLVVLTIYFLADLPRIRAAGYRLVPASRRPRAILLGDGPLPPTGGGSVPPTARSPGATRSAGGRARRSAVAARLGCKAPPWAGTGTTRSGPRWPR